MYSERPTLADQSIQQQGCVGGNLIVLDEQLLEFINDQQDPGHHRSGMRVAVRFDILDAGRPEQVAAPMQFDVQSLEDTQAEFPFAFDRNDPSLGQLESGIRLELNTFLEVDQIKV